MWFFEPLYTYLLCLLVVDLTIAFATVNNEIQFFDLTILKYVYTREAT